MGGETERLEKELTETRTQLQSVTAELTAEQQRSFELETSRTALQEQTGRGTAKGV